MTDLNQLPKEMFDHYQQIKESERLFSGVGELERERTQSILSRYMPKAPSVVLDVGGAAGVHALWLARQGYKVHLSDPVKYHVEQAIMASSNQPEHPLASALIGDARKIDQPDGSADAALLLGPLYHLVDRKERLKALREVHRVLKVGGKLFAATICRFASLLDGLSRDLVVDPYFVKILKDDLKNGQHRNPSGNPSYFTTTFFHHPDELKAELIEAGFQFERIIGVEGPVWFLGNFSTHWHHPEKQKLLLDLLVTIEDDPAILGASAHHLGIAQKKI